ncbi:integrase [Streptomyces sp. NPDC002187]|uniref:integrase n=1 Tax=Streptomyces sp. NPDC002187 TaxID=3364637 RepID=UPI0036A2E726
MATSENARGVQGLTRAELLALPAAVDLDTANRALSIGRSTGYALAKRGQYPCRVLRLGNAYRVITADLLSILGIKPDGRTDQPSASQVA